jgi:hypothetical protein
MIFMVSQKWVVKWEMSSRTKVPHLLCMGAPTTPYNGCRRKPTRFKLEAYLYTIMVCIPVFVDVVEWER